MSEKVNEKRKDHGKKTIVYREGQTDRQGVTGRQTHRQTDTAKARQNN